MNEQTELDVNIMLDDIIQKYIILLKENAVKTAHISSLKKELEELKNGIDN